MRAATLRKAFFSASRLIKSIDLSAYNEVLPKRREAYSLREQANSALLRKAELLDILHLKHFQWLTNHLPYLVIFRRTVFECLQCGVAKPWRLIFICKLG